MTDLRITRLVVKNYRGIAALDEKISPLGAIAKGRNGGGKTSALRAIRACLAAQDISADAIRNGEERAEILIDLDDVSVQRVITSRGSTLKVTKGGMVAQKPQHFLSDLLGTSPLDPLDLFLARPKERRAKVLEALPVSVTPAQLKRWAPVPDDVDVRGHGLEVVARVHADFYARRTTANKAYEEAHREVERLRKEADSIQAPPCELTEAAAVKALADAKAEAARLKTAADQAKEAVARTAAAREQIASQRAKADELRGRAVAAFPPRGALEEAQTRRRECLDRLNDARDLVERLESEEESATLELDRLSRAKLESEGLLRQADERDVSAQAMEDALGAAIADIPEANIQAAVAKVAEAREILSAAELQADLQEAKAKVIDAERTAGGKREVADDLDTIVKKLANEAPATLLREASAIPGLTLDGDDIVLDGVRLDALCGSEQMKFAVDVAKRLNAKSRILVVDGLERLDSQQMREFVRAATAGGFQLIATKVSDGAVVVEAIELEGE
jgi:hypothetical protein